MLKQILLNDNSDFYSPNLDYTLERYLTVLMKKFFFDLNIDTYHSDITISDRPTLCQFQCNVAMPLSKQYRFSSTKIATLE